MLPECLRVMAAAALVRADNGLSLALDSRYDSSGDEEDPNVLQPAAEGETAGPILTAADLKEQAALEAEALLWEEQDDYDSADDWDDDGVWIGNDVKATGALWARQGSRRLLGARQGGSQDLSSGTRPLAERRHPPQADRCSPNPPSSISSKPRSTFRRRAPVVSPNA